MKWRTNGALGKPVPEKRKTAMFAEWLNKAVCSGAGNGTRTHDLRITNALLYQLSYTGTQEMRLYRKRFFCAMRRILKNGSVLRLWRTVEVGGSGPSVNQKVRTGDKRTSRIHDEMS